MENNDMDCVLHVDDIDDHSFVIIRIINQVAKTFPIELNYTIVGIDERFRFHSPELN